MQSEIILNFYWDIFLSHVCEFYPLDQDFVEKYEYELDWSSISKNKCLQWDIAFLEKYEQRFKWHQLAWNDSIIWNEDKIERFKKRLDWYYLGRNRNLPLSDNFILKYWKKIFVTEDNPHLTKELIEKYDLKFVQSETLDTQSIKKYIESDFHTVFNCTQFHHNQKVIYELVFLPILKTFTLPKIFEDKFCYEQRYYYVEPVKSDIHGLTPEFEIKDDNPFKVFREDRGLFEINDKLTLISGPLQEGPDRLYEVPRFSSSYYTTLLVSENVKSILSHFKLPDHVFHEVKLVPQKIITKTKFYILHLPYDTLNRDLEYENRLFSYIFRGFKQRGYGLINKKINSRHELTETVISIARQVPQFSSVMITPDQYILKTDFDMYTCSTHGKIIVNQMLKDALENELPGQIFFRSAQLINIKIKQEEYDRRRLQGVEINLSNRVSFEVPLEVKYYYSKGVRLENNDIPLTAKSLIPGRFLSKELELNVIFPESFKLKFESKQINLPGYEILPIPEFYIQNAYADKYPETYKSVAIAENGVGDSINLILEKDSDYRLQNRLFEFFHETGEYQEL